ncbi:MAG: GNAT family N-acetyltransferase [Thermoplasmata archaeon]
MKVVAYDELPRRFDRHRGLLQVTGFQLAWTRRIVDLYRRDTDLLSDYVGLYAIEDNEVLGQVVVFRMPYTFPTGLGKVAGISFVVTRPDSGRKGIARSLLTEAHQRERSAGIRHVTLWTSRAWAAHRLYQGMGYRDLYGVQWAFRERTRRSLLPRGYHVRTAARPDLKRLDQFHSEFTQGRWGFVPRTKALFQTDCRAHELEVSNLRLLTHRGGLSGYAMCETVPGGVTCGELLGASSRDEELLIQAVEREARGGFSAFAFTPLTQRVRWFSRRGYAISPGAYQVWMGMTLGHVMKEEATRREFGSNDPRFLCLSHDRF